MYRTVVDALMIVQAMIGGHVCMAGAPVGRPGAPPHTCTHAPPWTSGPPMNGTRSMHPSVHLIRAFAQKSIQHTHEPKVHLEGCNLQNNPKLHKPHANHKLKGIAWNHSALVATSSPFSHFQSAKKCFTQAPKNAKTSTVPSKPLLHPAPPPYAPHNPGPPRTSSSSEASTSSTPLPLGILG